jgi:hypothetical protein
LRKQALKTTDLWTKDAVAGTLRLGALHGAEELSDDVLATIEGTF